MRNIFSGPSKTQRAGILLGAVVIGLAVTAFNPHDAAAQNQNGQGRGAPSREAAKFRMVVSAGAAGCLPNATATVKITPTGPVEVMDVTVRGLPPNTEFDLFVIQVPLAPFGIAWYQGDIETDSEGEGHQRFIGRFNIETFAVAQPPGGQPAPVVHHPPESLVSDDSFNPAFEPIHTYHLGLWFGSPADAVKAGCANTETRFNGDHNAGIQVLHTTPLSNGLGPLSQVR